MLWNKKLKNWENGIWQKYPKKYKNRFFWNTSVLKKHNTPYIEKFKMSNHLPKIQNYKPFEKFIKKSKNNYAVSFMSLGNDTRLVIPMPRNNKNFSTFKDFTDNASNLHKKKFWQYVAKEIKKEIKKENIENIWVSSHGLGVSYFHIRISQKPKYYFNSELKKE